jgi:transposase
MSASGPVALVSVNGTMSAARYINILQDNIISFLENQPLSNNFWFQQDNAPSHKAQSTTAFLNANAVEVLPWPPYSPDLSPIENMWAVVKRRIREQGSTSIEELSHLFVEIWTSPEMICMCRTLMDSMPRRIEMCIKNKGGYTKY